MPSSSETSVAVSSGSESEGAELGGGFEGAARAGMMRASGFDRTRRGPGEIVLRPMRYPRATAFRHRCGSTYRLP